MQIAFVEMKENFIGNNFMSGDLRVCYQSSHTDEYSLIDFLVSHTILVNKMLHHNNSTSFLTGAVMQPKEWGASIGYGM